MKLSVIVVNYNVKFFLEQCLLSIEKSIHQMRAGFPLWEAEIIVVDNASVDGSGYMIREKFPNINYIENIQNNGFAAANNQALRIARGEYVLIINPDTVIEEYTLQKTIDFMDKNPGAGALGVKMIDGKGNFLPESKRSLPTPAIAFFKIFGFSRIFPRSKIFGKYHLGYLDPEHIHEVEVLAGAFMLVRKAVLEKTGFFDETFFMYGEDIDLSYRILQVGYKNYYFPETQIIHYKGESTKKSSVNYVFVFYKAMIIFAKKHFSRKNASLFSLFINLAIYIRAFGAIIYRFFSMTMLIWFDIILLFSGLYLVKIFWENFSYGSSYNYPEELTRYIFPVYIFLWMIGLLLVRGYKIPYKISKILKGVIFGTILISILYAFLEEGFRFSRAIIILGSVMAFAAFLLSRLLVHFIREGDFKMYRSVNNNIAIIGKGEEAERVLKLLQDSNFQYTFKGFIYPDEKITGESGNFIGDLSKIEELINVNRINEIIFCGKDIPSYAVIKLMTKLQNKDVVFKIAPKESLFIIGSNNKNSRGDLYTIDIQLAIVKPSNKVYKRLIDLSFAFLCLLFSPVLLLFQKNNQGYYRNIISVLAGKCTFVSYMGDPGFHLLPEIRYGILRPAEQFNHNYHPDETEIAELDMIYSKNYSPVTDLLIIFKNINKLGRKMISPGKP